jgi:hypothetical protein
MLRITPVPLAAFAFACLASLAAAGCEEKRGSPPIARDQRLTGATVTRPPVAERQGEPDIARFADETRLSPTPATLMPETTRVRRSPGGEPLVMLRGGTEVVELARARNHYLVQFSTPNDPWQRMTGWVYKDALESWGPPDEIVATGSKVRACAKGDVHVQSDHDFCARPCREDGDCQGPGVCDGEALVVNGARSERARYCVVAEADQ